EAGNVAEARRMLERQRPRPGEDDLRGFEWHYWDRQTHAELSSVTLPITGVQGADRWPGPRITEWGFSGDGMRVAYFKSDSFDMTAEIEKPTLQVGDVATRKQLLSQSIPVDGLEKGRRYSVSSSLSLSHDGKRAAVAVTLTPTMPFDGETVQRLPRLPSKSMVRVWDVESGEVLFKSDKDLSGTGERVARLSRDGHKLLTHTPETQSWGGAGLGHSEGGDLDAGERK